MSRLAINLLSLFILLIFLMCKLIILPKILGVIKFWLRFTNVIRSRTIQEIIGQKGIPSFWVLGRL